MGTTIYYSLDAKVDLFALNYQELRGTYLEMCAWPDDYFMAHLPAALHLACFICWFKGHAAEHVLSDTGIIHELVHLLHLEEGEQVQLEKIRELFRTELELAR